MTSTTKCKFYLTLIMIVIYIWASNVNASSRVYQRLYEGHEKIYGFYSTVTANSSVRCAANCSRRPAGCWVFMWSSLEKECKLLKTLTSLVTTVPASPSLYTYYVRNAGGGNIVLTPRACNWEDCKTSCESLGGHLFFPRDKTFALVLLHVFKVKHLLVGAFRPKNDTTTWFGMDWNPISWSLLYWDTGKPNNKEGKEYYIRLQNGNLNDVPITNIHQGLCEV